MLCAGAELRSFLAVSSSLSCCNGPQVHKFCPPTLQLRKEEEEIRRDRFQLQAEISQCILGPSYGLDSHRIRVQFLAQEDTSVSSNVHNCFETQTLIQWASWALASEVKQPGQHALLFSSPMYLHDAVLN
jgi:hypothetical protein